MIGVYADLTRPESNTWVVDNVRRLQSELSRSAPEIPVKFPKQSVRDKTVSAAAWGKK